MLQVHVGVMRWGYAEGCLRCCNISPFVQPRPDKYLLGRVRAVHCPVANPVYVLLRVRSRLFE